MKEIKVNDLEELLAEVKKYADTHTITTKNVYRLFTEWNSETREEKEGIGVKLNDQINIYIGAKKSSEQSEKFDQLFTELKKEINKLLSDQTNLKAEKDYHYHEWGKTSHWTTIKDDLREFFNRHKKSIKQNKKFDHWVSLDEDKKGFYVYLNHPDSDIRVTIYTAKDEISNAELAKNILKLKKELEVYWNDLIKEKLNQKNGKVSKYCSNHGIKKVITSDNYCPECGQLLHCPTRTRNNSSANKGGLLISLILISLLAVGLFWFLLLNKKKKK